MGHYRALPPHAECRWADVSLPGLQGSSLKESGGLFLVLCHSRHRDLTPWWCRLWPVCHSWLPRAERFKENPSLCQSDSLLAGGIQIPELQPQGFQPHRSSRMPAEMWLCMVGMFHSQDWEQSGKSGSELFSKWFQCLPNLIPLINKHWKGVQTYSCSTKVHQLPRARVRIKIKNDCSCDPTFQDCLF